MMGNHKSILCKIMFILVIIGGLNWGLVGALNINLVTMIFGHFPMVEKLIYILVGVSAIGLLVGMIRQKCLCCGACKTEQK